MTQHLPSLALRTYLFWSATAFVLITSAVWALDPERGFFGRRDPQYRRNPRIPDTRNRDQQNRMSRQRPRPGMGQRASAHGSERFDLDARKLFDNNV